MFKTNAKRIATPLPSASAEGFGRGSVRVFEQNGVCINDTGFRVDPSSSSRTQNIVISHAHSDHVNFNRHSIVYCSKETLSLIEANYRKVRKAHAMEFGKKKRFDSFDFSLHNSGHILGSAQILIEGEQTIAITSDFKLQDSLVTKKAVPLNCDTLIIETTFGLPDYEFLERELVYSEMEEWCKKQIERERLVVLAGYSVGKAQELTAFCNHFLGIAPLVHERIYQNNKVYESHNIKLGEYLKLNHNLKESSILIMPPSLCNSHLLQALEFSTKRRVVSAMATGWNYRNHFNKIFHLSDHCSFDQLFEYVKQAEPKQVLTMHGYCTEFARAIKRRLRIPARPLSKNPINQRFLTEFD